MRIHLPLTCLVAIGVGACADGGAGGTSRAAADSAVRPVSSAEQSREALPRDAARALDSANAAFRAGRLDAALAGYRRAAARAPEHAAPYYGIFMVARRTRNAALADSATSAIRARSRRAGAPTPEAMAAAHGELAPGAHAPVAADSGTRLPAGHPPLAPRAPRALPPEHPPVPARSRANDPATSGAP